MKTLFTWMTVAFTLYTSMPALAQTHRATPINGNSGIVDRANQERAERERRERERRDHGRRQHSEGTHRATAVDAR